MKHLTCDVAVIGSGPAGLAAAYAAREAGAGHVLVLERNEEPGGILTQCIHNGFGLRIFDSDLTGPEYATRWIDMAVGAGAEFMLETMVLSIAPGLTLTATNGEAGLVEIRAGAVVAAMGCRERPRGALAIPGSRPAGIYTAGTAQRLVNIEGYMPGRRFVILGSGDIGMIMARRLTLEGAEVVAMAEVLPYVSGLRRNLVQCVHDFDIPLSLCTTVSEVRGRERIESVVLSQVDERWQPVPGTEEEMACDTLLLSVGLIPENELSRMAGVALDPITGGPYVDERLMTNVPGILAAGNVLHVYDLVDDVTESALRAGHHAAAYAERSAGERGAGAISPTVEIKGGENVRCVVPQRLHVEFAEATLQFRVRDPVEASVRAQIMLDGECVMSKRLRYVRPSEMVSLDLPRQVAPRLADGAEVRVDVVA